MKINDGSVEVLIEETPKSGPDMPDEKIQNDINNLKERVDRLEVQMKTAKKREDILLENLNHQFDDIKEKFDVLIEEVKKLKNNSEDQRPGPVL